MKILIIRFSSFGDVLQTLSVAGRLSEAFPQCEIHWVTRSEFAPLVHCHPRVSQVWSLPAKSRGVELVRLGLKLRAEKFTHVYDAHNNLRSHILGWMLWSPHTRFLRRSIYRWRRFLLFRFHINQFPKPFSGQSALLEPLRHWGLSTTAPAVPQLNLPAAELLRARQRIAGQGSVVALAPSAAFPLKRWPLSHWRALIEALPHQRFVVLGGREDGFLEELKTVAPDRVINLAGQLTLLESAAVVAESVALVANDTGLMHVAEQVGRPCLALMGPAPFGFPSRPLTEIFELDLKCRPCSKHGQGPCVNAEYQKCLRDIHPRDVARSLRRVTDAAMAAPVSSP